MSNSVDLELIYIEVKGEVRSYLIPGNVAKHIRKLENQLTMYEKFLDEDE